MSMSIRSASCVEDIVGCIARAMVGGGIDGRWENECALLPEKCRMAMERCVIRPEINQDWWYMFERWTGSE
jgi:hypothetical protein